jgi:DNA-directed RNA polymerase subunit RPC12/RpoP
MTQKDQNEITEQRKELAAIVSQEKESLLDTFAEIVKPQMVVYECRDCLDTFTKPKFKFDYDYNQMAATCPCCGVFL